MVTSALQIGRSALETYQSALQAVGNNIANAGNPDYTRQSVGLAAVHGSPLAPGLQPGAGVTMHELKRHLDEQLENRVRAGIADYQSARASQQVLARVETLFDDTTGLGISSKLTEFFNSLSDVQNDPADLAIRDVALASGAELAGALGRVRGQLKAVGDEIDGQIEDLVAQADELASQIAELNREIAAAEAGNRGAAHALRDQRDGLLRDLSEIFDVSVRLQPDGSIYVYAGSEPLIMGGVSRGLTTEKVVDGSFTRSVVRFADSGGPVPVRGGRLAGLITARDEEAFGRIEAVDQLAAAIIFEVNRIHSEGQGLSGFTSVTGTYAVVDATAALNSDEADLNFTPRNGSFFIAVTDDATGTVVAYQIEVDLDGIGSDTTLESLVADINATVEGVTAEVTSDGRFKVEADTGFSFTFGHDGGESREDTADLLAALGINTFFEGSNAADMKVNEVLMASAGLLAAAMVKLDGDGANAGRLAEVGASASAMLGGSTIAEGYIRMAGEVALAGASALDEVEVSEAVLSALQAQRESISGVNLDEEAINLLKFERAFQGAARYVATVDRLLSEMMSLVR
jgi:flagellar hook-associated protein 1 FlgK